MATVHIVLSQVTNNSRGLTGSTMPIADAVPVAADTMAPTSTSTQSTIVAAAPNQGLVWTVTSLDQAVWINFGLDPTAATDTGRLLLAGDTRDWAVSTTGEKIAIKVAP